jgi:hypothetical protein
LSSSPPTSRLDPPPGLSKSSTNTPVIIGLVVAGVIGCIVLISITVGIIVGKRRGRLTLPWMKTGKPPDSRPTLGTHTPNNKDCSPNHIQWELEQPIKYLSNIQLLMTYST